MEKVFVGYEMATRWSDPPIMLMLMIPGLLTLLGSTVYLAFNCWYSGLPVFAPAPCAVVWLFWNFVYHRAERGDPDSYIIFKNPQLKSTYARRKIPMCELYEHFIEGDIAFKGDCLEVLSDHRYEFVNFKPTWTLLRFLLEQFVPQTSSSFKDKAATKKEIADHYDRGNDFFNSFLGPSMVYTSGVFKGLDQSLEEAQFNKMSMICEKVHLKKGETFLDIGCGWGTLARHAAKHFGAKSTGVTLSMEGARWCNETAAKEGLSANVTTLQVDYRDIPQGERFNKIASIEMAEHVGIANFQLYLKKVRDLMEDDGIFLMQVAGLRQGSNWEDVSWGLFMSKYIFPGADASTPLNWYIKQCELAGFEVHSVETIGRHYSHTLHKWYDNWISNRDKMEKAYGTRLYRMWEIFLAWSTIASGQGTATCYQIAMHKNTYDYPRDRWCDSRCVSDSGLVGTGIGSMPRSAQGSQPRSMPRGY